MNGENGFNVLMVGVVSPESVWLHSSFQTDVTAIVFVVSCSSFDTVIREDGKTVSLLWCLQNSFVKLYV